MTNDKAKCITEQKRIAYLDNLRVMASFAVVMIHVSAQNWYSQDVSAFAWKVFNVYDSLSRWAVPIFVMISGALMLEKEYSLNKLYTNKILRLLTAYCFWCVVYALIDGGSARAVFLNIAKGKYHLWFIPLIMGLYISVPFIKKIVAERKIMEYFLAVAVIFSFLIPFTLKVLSDFGGSAAGEWMNALTDTYSDMYAAFDNGYIAYFVAGYYLNTVSMRRSNRIAIYILGALGTVLTIFLSLYISAETGKPVVDYYEYLNLNVFVQSVAVFVFFKYSRILSKTPGMLRSKLSEYSFCIYVVHLLVMERLDKVFNINTLTCNPVLSVPALTIVVFILTSVISALIKQIPVLKNYIA